MAIFRGTIESEVLHLDTELAVILPYDRPSENQQTPCKVLYLLHGLSDNAYAWTRYTGIERYARKHGYAVIMPEVNRSFYTDMKYGLAYFTYLTQELPLICSKLFNLSDKREDNFIAGLSMGGYGAFKAILNCPDRYAGAASFSGALDMSDVIHRSKEMNMEHELIAMLGEGLKIPADETFDFLAQNLAEQPAQKRPKLFMTCGKQDFIFSHSENFSKLLDKLEIAHTYITWDGDHEWGFWDKSVEMAMDFFEEALPTV